MRPRFNMRRCSVAAAVVLLGSSLLTPSVAWAGQTAPASFDRGAELLPLDRVAVALMGPVENETLIDEDRARDQSRRRLAEWMVTGGAMPRSLLDALDETNRDRFGAWLLVGGPIPSEVLETLPADRAANLANVALAEATRVPAVLLEELSELKRLFEKKQRVGLPMPALTGTPQANRNISPANSGTWESLPEGHGIWRLRVRSNDALWLVLGFRTFRPAPGARLHIYAPECVGDPDCDKLLGPFTVKDIREHRQLWTPPIDGEELVIELFWPRGLAGIEPDVVLGTVSHGYLAPWPDERYTAPTLGGGPDKGLGDSGFCNVDIACEPDWNKEERGVVHLLLYGSSWCSASLINNTDFDCRPYVLTARHCINTASEAAGTTFRFKYQRANCGSGSAPTHNMLTGSTLRATWSATDVTLLEMNQAPSATFNAYFNGWSRVDNPSQLPSATGIHHPSGDAKMISFEFDGLTYGGLYGPDHWRVPDWDPTAHGEGTTEGGSSGSPLFDTTDPVGAEPHIVGQLHGGYASCYNDDFDEYGRFDLSWTGGGSASNRLSDWLDPAPAQSPTTLGGLDHETCLNPLPDLGYVEYFLNDPVGNQNGFPEPSEEIDLQISVENFGGATATNVAGELSTTVTGVTITQSSASWRDIQPGTHQVSVFPPFHLSIDGDFACELGGTLIPLTLEVTSDQNPVPVTMEFDVPIGIPVPREIMEDDLEPEAADGWETDGLRAWTLLDSADPEDTSSPTHSWFVADRDTPVLTWLRMPTLPPDNPQTAETEKLPEQAKLRFQTRFLTENNIDGGVLEYSVNGGATWYDITHDAASGEPKDRFIANGYNGHILAMDGRAAWEGDSGGWQQVEVDLADFAGRVLSLRFRFAANDGNVVEVDGWYIDDVVADYNGFTCPILGPPAEVTGLLLGKPEVDQVSLRYDTPAYGAGHGGPVETYTVQSATLPGPLVVEFLMNLGEVTYSEMEADLLPSAQGILIVGENAQGPGPTGSDSEGIPRPPAEPVP